MDKDGILLLKPRKTRQVRLLITSLIFVLIGVCMLEKHNMLGWLPLSFFGLAVLVFAVNLLPNSSYLRLTNDGFEVRQLFRSNFYKWSDVQDFQAGAQHQHGIPIRTYVAFNFASTYPKAPKARALAKVMTGSEGQLADNFGMEAQNLAELMAQWKANAR
jgi:hypothetical protein